MGMFGRFRPRGGDTSSMARGDSSGLMGQIGNAIADAASVPVAGALNKAMGGPDSGYHTMTRREEREHNAAKLAESRANRPSSPPPGVSGASSQPSVQRPDGPPPPGASGASGLPQRPATKSKPSTPPPGVSGASNQQRPKPAGPPPRRQS